MVEEERWLGGGDLVGMGKLERNAMFTRLEIHVAYESRDPDGTVGSSIQSRSLVETHERGLSYKP